MDKIKAIKNFLTADEAKYVRDFADRAIDGREYDIILDQIDEYSARPLVRFGSDNIPGNCNEDFSVLPDEEKQFFESLAGRAAKAIQETFDEPDDLYTATFWVSRQYPGGKIDIHEDTDGGLNSQYIYSAIIYLNTLPDEGHLIFDELNYSVHPEEGDLVAFLTQETGRHYVKEVSEMRYSIPIWLVKDISYKLPY